VLSSSEYRRYPNLGPKKPNATGASSMFASKYRQRIPGDVKAPLEACKQLPGYDRVHDGRHDCHGRRETSSKTLGYSPCRKSRASIHQHVRRREGTSRVDYRQVEKREPQANSRRRIHAHRQGGKEGSGSRRTTRSRDRTQAHQGRKFATDVTARKRADRDTQGQLDDDRNVTGRHEFNLSTATIITATRELLQTLGYRLEEIQ